MELLLAGEPGIFPQWAMVRSVPDEHQGAADRGLHASEDQAVSGRHAVPGAVWVYDRETLARRA